MLVESSPLQPYCLSLAMCNCAIGVGGSTLGGLVVGGIVVKYMVAIVLLLQKVTGILLATSLFCPHTHNVIESSCLQQSWHSGVLLLPPDPLFLVSPVEVPDSHSLCRETREQYSGRRTLQSCCLHLL